MRERARLLAGAGPGKPWCMTDRSGRGAADNLLELLTRVPDHAVLLGLLGNPAPPVAGPASPGVAAKKPASPREAPRPALAMIAGVLLAAPSGWYLFVQHDVINAPGLIVHFPGAYVLLFSALVGGLLLIVSGVRGLRRGARRG